MGGQIEFNASEGDSLPQRVLSNYKGTRVIGKLSNREKKGPPPGYRGKTFTTFFFFSPFPAIKGIQ
jgi:hypothetical protein